MEISRTSRYLPQVNINTTKAQLIQKSQAPSLEITRKRGNFEIESHPIKLDIDNRAFFDSIGLKSIGSLADDLVVRGRKAVLEGEADAAEEAQLMSIPQKHDAISEIALMRSQKSIETALAFIPEHPPKMNWSGGDVNIDFTPDELNFKWDTGGIEWKYIPYDVDFTVLE